MEETKRRTVGAISSELMQKAPETTDPIELERAMQEDYLAELIKTVEEFRKTCFTKFYVVVITKNEKLMPNVFRNYFTARHSCPTPDYDQSVFVYDPKQEELSYLWTIPNREACHYFKNNAVDVVPEEKHLLQFVLDFADGSLYELAKKLNGEQPDSPLTIQ